jgi:hypothetical protein
MKQEIFKVQKFKKIKINNLALKESEELLDKYLNKTKHLKTQI